MSDCLSPHLPKPQSHCTRLVWLSARDEPRRRTLAWTCHCADVIYELCTTGGQSYLRRIDSETGEIVETHRVNARDGQAMWEALLSGLVR
jgi:hypothetical protein